MYKSKNYPMRGVGTCLLGAVVVCAAGPLASAQQDRVRTQNRTQQQSGVSAGERSDRAMNKTYRASNILGSEVQNPEGQDLGEVQDVVLDIRDGQVAYIVLSFGGWLGIGDDYFAIPFDSFGFDVGEDQPLRLDLPKASLERAEGFADDSWPDMADKNWATKTHANYDSKPYWEHDEKADADQAVSSINRRGATIAQDDLWVHQVSELIGLEVNDPANESIGEIEDIVISRDAKIVAVVINHGGEIGSGGELAAVPWKGLMVDRSEEVMQLRTDASKLLPLTFDADNWPDFMGGEWKERFDKQYPDAAETAEKLSEAKAEAEANEER